MNIQVFIFNYKFFHQGLNLYNSFKKLNYKTHLLNCSHPNDPPFDSTDEIKMLPNIHYSGQWNEALKLLEPKTDVFLIVCSDVTIKSPKILMNKLESFYNKYGDNAGIYAPNAWWTPWTYNPKLLKDLGKGCKEVVATDSMIWSVHKSMAQKVGPIDLSINKIGWGIEILASLYCKQNKRLVARDYSVVVDHPQSSAYDRTKADQEFRNMISKLPNSQQFWDHYNSRNKYEFGWHGNYNIPHQTMMI